MKLVEQADQFNIVDFDAQEAYFIAIRIEKDGLRFYSHLARSEQHPDVKNIFEFLAADETRHLRFFEQQLQHLQAESGNEEDNDVLESMDFGVFAPYDHIENLADVITDVKAALRLAVKVEDNAMRLYEACRDNIRSPQAKEQLNYIIEEERRHREVLRIILAQHA